ncbi:MAG: hypothetical protein ACQEQG_05810 [Bacillota bacterium]
MLSKYFIVSLITMLFLLIYILHSPGISANEININDLQDIITQETIYFAQEVPEDVYEKLGGYNALIFGEYHDISGHQELLAALLPGLHEQGYRYLLLEFPHAYSWIFDGYINVNQGIELPEGVRRTYGVLLEAIKEYNLRLEPEERFVVKAIDINHYSNIFVSSLAGLARQRENTEILQEFVEQARDDENYRRIFTDMETEILNHRNEYKEKWGEAYFRELEDMLYAESRSIKVRNSTELFDLKTRRREQVIKDIVDRYLEWAYQVIINTGYYHAQREYRFGTKQEWLGEYLADPDHYITQGNILSLVVAPTRGKMKFDQEVKEFSLPEYDLTDPENIEQADLFSLIAANAHDQIGFLTLENPYFLEHPVKVNFHFLELEYKVKNQFDGFFLLPEVEYIGE